MNNDRGGQENLVTKSDFNLDRYLPSELLSKLEAARARNTGAGERRVITMLFCDLKGSTAAAGEVDPETWTEIMNGAFEVMIRPIYKYEGLVPRLMGDAILAFFGAPLTHEDDPQRAVWAALEIQSGVKEYAESVRQKHGLEFAVRVGINTGLVVVGEIGSDLRMEYTAIGDAINLAARMEQTAQPGTIQISDETYKLIAPFFDTEDLGGIEVKGKSKPIHTYRVLHPKASPGSVRGLEGLISPLVGRESQLAVLNELVRQVQLGTGSVVSVLGEAGLGKSSLIAAVKKSSASARVQWLTGEAQSYARSISYFPWRQILRQSIDAREEDSPSQVRDKLRYVCDCCSLPGGDTPFLEAVLAVESAESLKLVAGYQGDALIQRMVEAVRGYLCGLTRESPLAIIFDDLHWADEASLNLLLSSADLILSQQILFVCLSRPDNAAPSREALNKLQSLLSMKYQALQLEPLGSGQTDTLLANLLGTHDLPQAVRSAIIEKADGNPFFVEEIIRSLIETQQLVRVNSHWQAATSGANIALPNTLRGVLNARIDRVPEATRNVLQNAAVIGRTFDVRVLQRLTGLNGGLAAHINYLKDASLIEPLHDEYAFRHGLIQEAAYDSILLKNRARLHLEIAQLLEELHADRVDEFAPLIANHFYAAGDARALKYDVIAGDGAARLFANAEAAVHYRRALEVARRSGADLEQISGLFVQLGHVLELAAHYEEALANYDEMQNYGKQSGARTLELTALITKATIFSTYTRLHDSALGEKTLLEALQLSGEIGDRAAQTRLNWNLMLTYLFSKRLAPAREHGEAALKLGRESGDREQLAFVLNDLCRLYTCFGEFDKAFGVIHEAREMWRELGNQTMFADSLGSEAEARLNHGEYDKTLELTAEALKLSEQMENLWGQSYNRMIRSFVYFDRGQIGRAIQLSNESIELGDKAGLLASTIGQRADVGLMYARYGDPQHGRELIEIALAEAEAKQPSWRALPQSSLVRLHLINHDVAAAERVNNGASLDLISIPYPRYTMLVGIANVELALGRGIAASALSLVDELLAMLTPLTQVDVPEVLTRRADALLALGRVDEAFQTLTEASALAEQLGSKPSHWPILTRLAKIQDDLGESQDARAYRTRAREIVEWIGEELLEVGLRDSFRALPEVRELLHSLD